MTKSVRDVLSGRARMMQKLHKPDTVKELEFVWKKVFAEVYQQGLVHLTRKNLGQLKLFMQHCPEGTAAKVLEHVIRNWIEFVKDVETKAGVKSTPSYPSIDFLLQHAWIAVSLAHPQNKAAPKKQEASTGVQNASSVQLISQPEEKPMSLDELMAILGDDTDKKE